MDGTRMSVGMLASTLTDGGGDAAREEVGGGRSASRARSSRSLSRFGLTNDGAMGAAGWGLSGGRCCLFSSALMDGGGDSACEEGGGDRKHGVRDTACEEGGDTACEEGGDTACEEGGDTACEGEGDAACEEGGEDQSGAKRSLVEETGRPVGGGDRRHGVRDTACEEGGDTACEGCGEEERSPANSRDMRCDSSIDFGKDRAVRPWPAPGLRVEG